MHCVAVLCRRNKYQIGFGKKILLHHLDHSKKKKTLIVKSPVFSFSVSLFHAALFGCGGHLFPSPLPSSLCVCTLTHSSLPWSPWSFGLAWGFEVVVKAWGHEEGRGVIMRSSTQLLLPNLSSSPFVSLPFHFHPPISASLLVLLPVVLDPYFFLLSSHPLPYLVFTSSSCLFQPLSLCDSQSAPQFLPLLSSPGGPLSLGPPLSLPCPAWPTVSGRQAG